MPGEDARPVRAASVFGEDAPETGGCSARTDRGSVSACPFVAGVDGAATILSQTALETLQTTSTRSEHRRVISRRRRQCPRNALAVHERINSRVTNSCARGDAHAKRARRAPSQSCPFVHCDHGQHVHRPAWGRASRLSQRARQDVCRAPTVSAVVLRLSSLPAAGETNVLITSALP